MKKTTVNSQNQLVRECIFTALMILMERKCFKEIKITEIVNKAGVSRMSYYRNYNSKEDIITFYLDKMLEDYLEIISNNEMYDRYNRKYYFIVCFKNNERLIRNLIKSGMESLILERINTFTDSVVELPTNKKAYLPTTDQQNLQFAVGGLFNVIMEWFHRGMTETVEEMAQKICLAH